MMEKMIVPKGDGAERSGRHRDHASARGEYVSSFIVPLELKSVGHAVIYEIDIQNSDHRIAAVPFFSLSPFANGNLKH